MSLVSIVIPAYNRERAIEKCLDSLTKLDYKNFEVILINDGSTDRTETYAKSFLSKLNLKIINCKKNEGICKARNIGISNSNGEYIVFIDSDSIVQSNWLDNLLNKLISNKLDAISGPVKDVDARNSFEEALCGTAIIGKGKLQNRLLVGGNMLFKKEVFNQLMFDESMPSADEDDLQFRLIKLGKKIGTISETYILHDHPINTWNEFITLCKTRGAGSAKMFTKHGKIPKDVILILIFYLLLLLSFFSKIFLLIALIILSLQILAIVYNEIVFKEKLISRTIKALHILLLYHFLKANFFCYSLQRKHSSCCSNQ